MWLILSPWVNSDIHGISFNKNIKRQLELWHYGWTQSSANSQAGAECCRQKSFMRPCSFIPHSSLNFKHRWWNYDSTFQPCFEDVGTQTLLTSLTALSLCRCFFLLIGSVSKFIIFGRTPVMSGCKFVFRLHDPEFHWEQNKDRQVRKANIHWAAVSNTREPAVFVYRVVTMTLSCLAQVLLEISESLHLLAASGAYSWLPIVCQSKWFS